MYFDIKCSLTRNLLSSGTPLYNYDGLFRKYINYITMKDPRVCWKYRNFLRNIRLYLRNNVIFLNFMLLDAAI